MITPTVLIWGIVCLTVLLLALGLFLFLTWERKQAEKEKQAVRDHEVLRLTLAPSPKEEYVARPPARGGLVGIPPARYFDPSGRPLPDPPTRAHPGYIR